MRHILAIQVAAMLVIVASEHARAEVACAGAQSTSDICGQSQQSAEALRTLGAIIEERRLQNSGAYAKHFGIYALNLAGAEPKCETLAAIDYDYVLPGLAQGSPEAALRTYRLGWSEKDSFKLQSFFDYPAVELQAKGSNFSVTTAEYGKIEYRNSGTKMGAFAFVPNLLMYKAEKIKTGARYSVALNCGTDRNIMDVLAYHLAAVTAGPYLSKAAGDHAHDPAGILANARKAIELAPGYWPARLWAAIGHHGVGEQVDALAEVNHALEAEPRNPDVRTLRANIYLKLGQRDRALQDFEKAISQEPLHLYTRLSQRRALREPPEETYFNPFSQKQ